jgi:protocatechuate 3,4-dioxygenase alpha subunit
MTQTPSQTVGPYFAYGLSPQQYLYNHTSIASGNLRTPSTQGEPITIKGRVLDGQGQAIPDAMIEIWQADAKGQYNPTDSDFKGFGRFGTGTDPEAQFIFQTIKPASVDGQAPHITVVVFMRGLLTHAYTRLYFSDETTENQKDIILNTVPEERRNTLIAQRYETPEGIVYQWDIVMQGEQETVFFDV